MAVKFRKQALKFLQKATVDDANQIQTQLRQLIISIEEKSIIPFTELDIKKLKGEWQGFYRLRIGKIRVIFSVDFDTLDIEIYNIGSRSDIYK